MISLICAWVTGWVNNREVDGLRYLRAHYDVTVMQMVIMITVTGIVIWKKVTTIPFIIQPKNSLQCICSVPIDLVHTSHWHWRISCNYSCTSEANLNKLVNNLHYSLLNVYMTKQNDTNYMSIFYGTLYSLPQEVCMLFLCCFVMLLLLPEKCTHLLNCCLKQTQNILWDIVFAQCKQVIYRTFWGSNQSQLGCVLYPWGTMYIPHQIAIPIPGNEVQ